MKYLIPIKTSAKIIFIIALSLISFSSCSQVDNDIIKYKSEALNGYLITKKMNTNRVSLLRVMKKNIPIVFVF